MRQVLVGLAVLSLWPGGLAEQALSTGSQDGVVHVGRLDPEIRPHRLGMPIRLSPVPRDQWDSLPELPGFEDRVSSGKGWRPGSWRELPVLLIESSAEPTALYVDMNDDGVLGPEERFSFGPSPEPHLSHEILVQFAGGARSFPVRFGLHKPLEPRFGADLSLTQSLSAFATGEVSIGGRSIRLRIPYRAETADIDLRHGEIGLDVDGDGTIEGHTFSREVENAREQPVVFRVESRYVMIDSADASAGIVILREQPASAYRRIEAEVGDILPEVRFTDLDGQQSSLAAFRGRHLLLDFCGFWCPPCQWEIPTLVEAYQKFRSRGFDIVSFDVDDDPKTLAAFVRQYRIGWTQVPSAAAQVISQDRFRVRSYPSRILIDPDGRVISAGRPEELPLREEALLETLETVLPSP